MAVRYYRHGAGPALLILHGWGSRASVMKYLAEGLADKRTCYVPDLPGFGDTPPPDKPWCIDDYVDFAEAFIKDVAGAPADVLAHSFGGRMVLKWCGRKDASGLLGKVLITGGAGMKPRRSFSYYRRRLVAMLLKSPFMILPDTLKIKALNWLRRTSIWKALGSSEYRQFEGVMRDTFVRTVTEHLDAGLQDVQHEVLLLWGKEDLVTPWYQAERMEKGLRNGVLVGIDNAGHYAFLDQPDRFLRIARAFFLQKGD
ncbi:MAG: alpha/beta hydrolase [Balneolales bacterium]